MQDNIDNSTRIIFDNDEDNTNSAKLLSWIERVLNDVRTRSIQLLQQTRTD
ncbi:hypothetical protein [Citrobacter freundii]|uniref:hypothetical protein n=1 Tax=Citrobacter freundii TaxID=546 RepID=UPI00397C7FBF